VLTLRIQNREIVLTLKVIGHLGWDVNSKKQYHVDVDATDSESGVTLMTQKITLVRGDEHKIGIRLGCIGEEEVDVVPQEQDEGLH